ncbi:hypothetical protein [Frondihabitans cladoniiphilus]|uniref:DUF2510 domain-containing protein n=1 Tax=Frondihabitans cladoniiphilus TaxID=715785 RepID=A0ABP8VN58_9MICO
MSIWTSGHLSPDGLYWWDGRRWYPTESADGCWRFDGTGWRPIPGREKPGFFAAPTWVRAAGATWLLVLMALLVGGLATHSEGSDVRAVAGSAAGLGLATVALCGILGRRRMMGWLWFVALFLTIAAVMYYVGAMLDPATGPASGGDDLAAVGLIVIGIPLTAAILLVVWAAAGLGMLTRLIRRR